MRLFAFALLFPAFAFAQEVAPAVAPATSLFSPAMIAAVVLAALGILGGIWASVLGPKLHAKLQGEAADAQASTTSKLLSMLGDRIDSFIEAGIAHAWPSIQADLKAGTSLAETVSHVGVQVEAYLGTEGLTEARALLGLGVDALSHYIEGLVKARVAQAQAAGALAAGAITTGPEAVAAINAGPDARPTPKT